MLEYPLALDFRFIFEFLVALVAAAKLSAVLLLGLLADFVLSLFAAFLKGDNSLPFEVSDWTVIEVVKGGAGEDQLAAET